MSKEGLRTKEECLLACVYTEGERTKVESVGDYLRSIFLDLPQRLPASSVERTLTLLRRRARSNFDNNISITSRIDRKISIYSSSFLDVWRAVNDRLVPSLLRINALFDTR